MDREQGKFRNPYVGGVALGLVLLATYAIMGKGLGASGASFRAGVAVVRGTDIEVPGWRNRLLAASVRLVPTRTAAAIARHMLESPPSKAKKLTAA